MITAAAFLMAGAMTLIKPREQLKEKMAWVGDVSPVLVKFMGVAELLGALGLILPPLFGVAEILTPIAATGLVLGMVGAMTLHLRLCGGGSDDHDERRPGRYGCRNRVGTVRPRVFLARILRWQPRWTRRTNARQF